MSFALCLKNREITEFQWKCNQLCNATETIKKEIICTKELEVNSIMPKFSLETESKSP